MEFDGKRVFARRDGFRNKDVSCYVVSIHYLIGRFEDIKFRELWGVHYENSS